ncbi:hypothetical protein PG999_006298 [Apiospora kogelbergensis]|uniref:Uncharacterized protein n=1 Tax=Apiospora kogelbergensis TaxID=1337665 RepID=A0AAW0QS88_9PEZI
MASHAGSSSKGDPNPSNPQTPKAVYVSVSVEPCNSEDTRKYWAEREARVKAGLANPSVHVNRANGEFDQGLVNAILAGKGELIATTVDGVRMGQSHNNMPSGSDNIWDDTVVHHEVSHGDIPNHPATDITFQSTQSVSQGSVLRTSDPFVDKQTTRRDSSQETVRYNVPLSKQVGSRQSASGCSPTVNPSDEYDIFIGGEPGPDVGPRHRAESRVRRPSTPAHEAPNIVHPGASSSSCPSYSVSTISRSGPRPASRSRRPSDVHQKSSATSLRSKFSSRSISTAVDDQDRPIVVTNALHHIIYDGPCDHCETNHCICLTTDSPGVPPADPTSRSSSRIATEGFCRHCVLNRCSCIVNDPRWGLRHASIILHQAQQKPKNTSSGQEQEVVGGHQSLRIISDAGTVRRYATGQDHDDSATSSENQMGTITTITASATAPTTPMPPYRVPRRLHDSGNDNDISNLTADNNVQPFGDVEAQQSERPSQLRRVIRMWRVRYQSHSHPTSDINARPTITRRTMLLRISWCLTASLAAALIVIGNNTYLKDKSTAGA